MTERAVFEALIWGAEVVGGLVLLGIATAFIELALRHAPAQEMTYEDDRPIRMPGRKR